jgi:hypothetical protein
MSRMGGGKDVLDIAAPVLLSFNESLSRTYRPPPVQQHGSYSISAFKWKQAFWSRLYFTAPQCGLRGIVSVTAALRQARKVPYSPCFENTAC